MKSTSVTTTSPGPNPPDGAAVKDEMMNDSSKRIPTRQQIAYGFGDFGNGFMFDLGQSYFCLLYTSRYASFFGLLRH